jgi:hypothetical protein
VDKVRKIAQIELDYSVGSLEHVDVILGQFHADQVSVNDVAITLFCFGCYVGEVIVRNNPGARWTTVAPGTTESSLNSGLLVQLPSGTILNPIGKVEKRLSNGEGDSVPYFYAALVQNDPAAA